MQKSPSDRQDSCPLILLCAGGTGGHAFPACALAEILQTRNYRVAIATDRRAIKYFDELQDTEKFLISSGGNQAGFMAKFFAVKDLLKGLWQSWKILKKLQPKIVIGFGGYPSVPPVLIAQFLNIPTIIHEQNAILGLANKILAIRAKKIALSVSATVGISAKHITKTTWTGNPVRKSIIESSRIPYILPDLSAGEKYQIMVVAGSQGAKIFSDLIPKALIELPFPMKSNLRVLQQARPQDTMDVIALYQESGIEVIVRPFFDDMAACLSNTHLLIARAGASTTAELTCLARPAIYIPFPWHKDQQQLRNANHISAAGGGLVFEEQNLTVPQLKATIEKLLNAPHDLNNMSKNAKSLATIEAVQKLCDLVIN